MMGSKVPSEFSNFKTTRVLIIGYGSIGRRHAGLFAQIGAPVTVVSRRADTLRAKGHTFCASLDALVEPRFDYVIIASETSAHLQDLDAILACDWAIGIPILVEKPLVGALADVNALGAKHKQALIYVGFNLRFLPVVMAARRHFEADQGLVRADFHSHSYLPHWRPDQDYRTTSSAQRSTGGGVLRDLSHELDLLLWFCGMPRDLQAFGGKMSELDIDVEDNVQIVGASDTCKLFSVSLSYSQHIETRSLSLISDQKTVLADLMSGTLTVADADGTRKQTYPCADFDETYRNMHIAVLEQGAVRPASFAEGAANVALIDRLTGEIGPMA